MCGISGILPFGSDPALALRGLARMHGRLRHRGPDGERTLLIGRDGRAGTSDSVPSSPVPGQELLAAFAFRRLRIQDLHPRADQPLTRNGRTWILFNGEIYNHHDLRKEIGGSFETTGDGETALAAWEKWGFGAFERFAGMWAILIVDLDRGSVIGSRDRLGIKPLCYGFEAGRLLFASEPAALIEGFAGPPQFDEGRLHQFLVGRPPDDPLRTFFDRVHYVPAGTCFETSLTLPVDSLSFRRYWDLPSGTGENFPFDRRAGAAELGERLQRAVESHMVADVPVGALLSGGLDSSTIARLMATTRSRTGHPPPRTFSIVYRDPAMDESRWIRSVIDQGGLDPTVETLDPESVIEIAPRVVAAQGEPILGQELVAQFRAFEMARAAGIIAVLDGQGADEIFGGYPFYEWVRLRGLYQSGHYTEAAGELLSLLHRHRSQVVRVALRRFLRDRSHRRDRSYDWLGSVPTEVDRNSRGNESNSAPDALQRLLLEQTFVTNLPAVLQYEDRNSMAHSVEARVPFLDHRIVELAFQIPSSAKIRRGERKRILRDYAQSILPRDVAQRRDKRAFVSRPDWLRLREHPRIVRSILDDGAGLADAGIEQRALEPFLTRYLHGEHEEHLTIWRLYTCSLWTKLLRERRLELR